MIKAIASLAPFVTARNMAAASLMAAGGGYAAGLPQPTILTKSDMIVDIVPAAAKRETALKVLQTYCLTDRSSAMKFDCGPILDEPAGFDEPTK